MIYEDKTALIRRGLFDVQNEVGLGRNEASYHRAFCSWLAEHAIPHASKQPHPIKLYEKTAHMLYPDIVVWDAITIELKALPRRLRAEDWVQIINYLKCRGDKLGLLVNMGLDRVYVERIVYDRPACEMSENWEAWGKETPAIIRDIGRAVQNLLSDIYLEHQTGFGSEIVEELLICGLREKGLSFIMNPHGPAVFRGEALGLSPLACMVVEKTLLITYTALFDDNDFNIRRGLSFIEALGLNWGLAINFGKHKLEVNGLYNNKLRPIQ